MSMNDDLISVLIGTWMRSVRQRAGMSQRAFATVIGVWPITLDRYEIGQKTPSLEVFFKVYELARSSDPNLPDLLAILGATQMSK